MIKQITKSNFMDEFRAFDRQEQFSYDALSALYDYYEDIDENMELDVIAICCEWTEYESIDEVKENYNDIETIEDLQNKTTVLELENGKILLQNY